MNEAGYEQITIVHHKTFLQKLFNQMAAIECYYLDTTNIWRNKSSPTVNIWRNKFDFHTPPTVNIWRNKFDFHIPPTVKGEELNFIRRMMTKLED